MKTAGDARFSKVALGRKGEELAEGYLKKEGYRILRKNYRCPLGEIDLVAKDRSETVFIEIKTRSSVEFGEPEEAIGHRKKRKLFQVAQYFLKETGLEDLEIRFDAISILLGERGRLEELRHLQGIFAD